MLRQIVKPTSEFYNIHIPKEYINQEIEIMVLPLFTSKQSNNGQAIKKDFNPEKFYGATISSKNQIDQFLLNSQSEWQ
jgi:hypothetical protein